MSGKFQLVDVFGQEPFTGNPLAVVELEADLDTDRMQTTTRWLNLSETAFLLPPRDPAADYRVRIFTLEREMPFAGHPTLGACHTWLLSGRKAKNDDHFVQECGAGLVSVRRAGATLAFAAPPLVHSGPVNGEKLQEIAKVLRIEVSEILDARWADNGPGWVAVRLASAEAVLAIRTAGSHGRRIDVGVVGLYQEGAPYAYEVRAFFTDAHGMIVEDPVTGSLNASIAEWLIGEGLVAPPYFASQGAKRGRAGRVAISRGDDGRIWTGGGTRTLFEGHATFL